MSNRDICRFQNQWPTPVNNVPELQPHDASSRLPELSRLCARHPLHHTPTRCPPPCAATRGAHDDAADNNAPGCDAPQQPAHPHQLHVARELLACARRIPSWYDVPKIRLFSL